MNFTEPMRVWKADGESPVLEKVDVARGFWRRAVGLLDRRGLPEREGLLIPHCSAVHTFGMRFAIDVLFVNDEGQVLALYPETPSGYVLTPRLRNVHVLEAGSGFIARYGIQAGDRLRFAPGEA